PQTQQGPGQANQNKTRTTNPSTKPEPAIPLWHKKHDTLSSSQTTHPPEFHFPHFVDRFFPEAPDEL
ncbi:MAG: hypothetical protein SO046_00790, partial [Actinomyces urogenitalis]|uniref:hypothetical protein n=1 Tax=Actinomyces urogenitalis TaxID=103621 RepID=UPI002A81E98D